MSKKNKDTSALENPRAIAEKLETLETWVERNRKFITVGMVVIFLAIGGYFGLRYYIDKQDQLAQREMFQAVYYFEADSLRLALEGDGNNLGFNQIIDEYDMTNAANLAQYYAGVISLKQGEFLAAIDYLNAFDTDDILLQAHGYSLTGDAHMELGEYDQAVSYYKKASSYKPNKFFTPMYMLKEALALEKSDRNTDAVEVYQQIIDQYWESNESSQAKKFMAQLHATP